MTNDTDRIEKKIVLRASRERVWRALTDSAEFGTWFGMKLEGSFAEGAIMSGAIRPTAVDPDIAKMQAPYEGTPVKLVIDRIEPMHRFSFRWHPYAVDDGDYSNEPMTLVTFELADADGGILLTVTESGFEGIPAHRRAEALKSNEGGWEAQTHLIEKYLAQRS